MKRLTQRQAAIRRRVLVKSVIGAAIAWGVGYFLAAALSDLVSAWPFQTEWGRALAYVHVWLCSMAVYAVMISGKVLR